MFGETAGLEWRHEDPQHLTINDLDGSSLILAQGGTGLSADAQRVTRVGLGHPEGFIESMANVYSDVADVLLRRRTGKEDELREIGYPTVRDGVIGIRFVEAVMASQAANGRWTDASIDI